jgi:hypothetical protein
MERKTIRDEIRRLKRVEADLLIKFALDADDCTDDHLSYVTGKIFEVSNLILRLQRALQDLDNER